MGDQESTKTLVNWTIPRKEAEYCKLGAKLPLKASIVCIRIHQTMRPKRASALRTALSHVSKLNRSNLNAGTQVWVDHQHRDDFTTNRVCLFPFSSLLISLYRLSPPSFPKYLLVHVHARPSIQANSSHSLNPQLTQRRIQVQPGKNEPLA